MTVNCATTNVRSKSPRGLEPDHVIYRGTFAKTLSPSIRLGYLALPQALVAPAIVTQLSLHLTMFQH
jgi:DNA-binding transcriptional MocR family regulator